MLVMDARESQEAQAMDHQAPRVCQELQDPEDIEDRRENQHHKTGNRFNMKLSQGFVHDHFGSLFSQGLFLIIPLLPHKQRSGCFDGNSFLI